MGPPRDNILHQLEPPEMDDGPRFRTVRNTVIVAALVGLVAGAGGYYFRPPEVREVIKEVVREVPARTAGLDRPIQVTCPPSTQTVYVDRPSQARPAPRPSPQRQSRPAYVDDIPYGRPAEYGSITPQQLARRGPNFFERLFAEDNGKRRNW